MSLTAKKEALYQEYSEKVRRYIFGKIQNKEDAEDLVNDIFLKVYEKFDSFGESRASVSTWIYTITRNTAIDYFRSRRTYSELPDNLSDDSRVDDSLLQRESLKSLGEALCRLDERSRGLIILRYYKGMTLKDAAARLGISYAYVKILHNQALKMLRKHF